MQEMYWLEQKALYAENTRIGVATQKGIEIGRADGIEIGKADGIMEGERKKQIEIAKKLLEIGLEIEDIEKATGLTKEEIEKLKN
jgi:predicted transposase/invertase (TIGR01784 family)